MVKIDYPPLDIYTWKSISQVFIPETHLEMLLSTVGSSQWSRLVSPGDHVRGSVHRNSGPLDISRLASACHHFHCSADWSLHHPQGSLVQVLSGTELAVDATSFSTLWGHGSLGSWSGGGLTAGKGLLFLTCPLSKLLSLPLSPLCGLES